MVRTVRLGGPKVRKARRNFADPLGWLVLFSTSGQLFLKVGGAGFPLTFVLGNVFVRSLVGCRWYLAAL